MKIFLHGKFADDYGPEHEIQATSVAEAVRALSNQLGFYDHLTIDKRPIAKVVGYDTEKELQECPDEIHLVPAMAGGKGVGKILIRAALIGAVALSAGGALFGSAFLGKLVFGVGLSLALGGIAQLFAKTPTLSGSNDPEASQYLGLRNNTTKLGTPRSYAMGRIKITAPHLLAINVDSADLVRGEFPA